VADPHHGRHIQNGKTVSFIFLLPSLMLDDDDDDDIQKIAKNLRLSALRSTHVMLLVE
jgi:hypothetical protein